MTIARRRVKLLANILINRKHTPMGHLQRCRLTRRLTIRQAPRYRYRRLAKAKCKYETNHVKDDVRRRSGRSVRCFSLSTSSSLHVNKNVLASNAQKLHKIAVFPHVIIPKVYTGFIRGLLQM